MSRVSAKGCLLFVLIVICYLPATRAGFIWDDDFLLTANPLVHAPDGLLRLWRGTETWDYYPVTMTSFWIEWRLWRTNPVGYHVTNVLLHALGSVLVWRVLRRLEVRGAWLSALLFAIHPVCVESVVWVAERKNTLSIVFAAVAVLLYLDAERTARGPRYLLAIVAFALALLTKTAVVMLPVALLLGAWYQRARITRRDWLRSLPFFALSGALGLLTLWFNHYRGAVPTSSVYLGGFGERLAGAGQSLLFYLSKAIVPVHLTMIYPRGDPTAAGPWSLAPALIVVVAVAAFWRYRRSWGRPALFGFGYFALMLLPVLGFWPMRYLVHSTVADHLQYFALVGPVALGVAAGTRAREAAPRARGAIMVLGILVTATLGLLTWQQQQIYRDAETLWRDTIAKNPAAWGAHANLAFTLATEGKSLEESVSAYRIALRLKPDWPPTLNGLAWLLATSRDPRLRDGREAVRLAERACQLTGYREATILDTLAAAYAEAGHPEDAVRIATAALVLAHRTGQHELAGAITTRLNLYRSGRAFRE